MSAAELLTDLSRHGLVLRGVLDPTADDRWPALPSGEAARLWLVGAVGSSLWAAFSASPEACDGQDDPLDRWSRRIGEHWAQRLGGVALFPFGGPPGASVALAQVGRGEGPHVEGGVLGPVP